ncbi:recombinase family protein [Synechococcus sp. A15-24]|uniref:recombinase family protein n=1 Tax=Synechococcus sp. A15-24 TaxID=1050635 RepID=UPI0016484F72|nr:recombinase family protein [Synechococcus sp. A15-24]QNJ28116.1 resolvase/ N terminal domain protein [Synechococcus sp. A15-24]
MRVAIYARVSTGSDEQENALEQQIARLEAAATAHGGNEPLRYIDIDSGSKDDRPELSRLIRDCGAGLMNTVVVTRLDRLSRSSSHGAELLRYFSQDNSPSLVALDDSLDLSTSGGRFMARMLISWAEAETDRLAERLKAGFKHRRDQRKPFGSKPLFSYVFSEDGSRYEPDPTSWHIAEEAIQRFLKDPNTGALVDWFHREHGIRWGSNYSLQRWIRNPTLAGARVYGQQRKEVDLKTGKKLRVSRPPGDFEEIIWTDDDGKPFQPALLKREQLAFIHSVYEARKQPDRRGLGHDTKILTGLVQCGDCGRNLHHHQPGKGADYWCLRCIAVGCPSRYKTMRARETAIAMFTMLQVHAAELVCRMQEVLAAQQNELSAGEIALKDRIQQLEAMDDPDLRQVLDKKRDELARTIQAKSSTAVETFIQQVQSFKQESAADLIDKEPALLRNLLKQFCRAEAAGGELKLLYVSEAIRRPGKSRAISVEGWGFGKAKDQTFKQLLTVPPLPKTSTHC